MHLLHHRVVSLLLSIIGLSPLAAAEPGDDQVLNVFVLAGQSNMEGAGIIQADAGRNGGRGSLEYAAKNMPDSSIAQWLAPDGNTWEERSDVFIHYLDRKGKLTPGYGAKPTQIGPELGFGYVAGEHFDAPVLLIKLAWGGKSLAVDFRPPSAGGETGPYYTQLITRTHDVLANVGELFPELASYKPQLRGIGWHQGWNDRINQQFNDEYEQNLSHLIRDLRKEFDAPKLPFVIAETGMSGEAETHPRALSLMRAQAAVAEQEEFRGNVAFVSTKAFFRPAEESPSGQAYHWNSNAETYYLIGEAMGQAMLKTMP